MKHRLFVQLVAGAFAVSAAGFAGAADVAKQRAEIRKVCDETLATLYKAKPELKAAVAKSDGYACFSSFGLTFLLGGAGGHGLVHNNASKRDTYMNMGQATAGLDVGIKDYREVLVFKNKATLERFVNSGWEFGGSAAAAAKAGKAGGAAEGSAAGTENIDIYPITKNGLQLGFSAGPRKYWKDKDLNGGK
jgi:lipid-binding SYLF domain-containing protein